MSHAESKRAFAFALLLLAGCVGAAALFRVPIFALLCIAGLAGAAFSRLTSERPVPSDNATGSGT